MQYARQPAREGDAAAPLEFTSSEQLRQHYKAVKARVRGAVTVPIVIMPALPEPEPLAPEPEPEAASPVADTDPAANSIFTLEEVGPSYARSRNEILRAVAAAAQTTVTELCSHLRSRPLVNARFVYYVLARKYSGASLPQIGSLAGYRDHSTVMHGIRQGARRHRELLPIYREACASLGVPIPDVPPFLGAGK